MRWRRRVAVGLGLVEGVSEDEQMGFASGETVFVDVDRTDGAQVVRTRAGWHDDQFGDRDHRLDGAFAQPGRLAG